MHVNYLKSAKFTNINLKKSSDYVNEQFSAPGRRCDPVHTRDYFLKNMRKGTPSAERHLIHYNDIIERYDRFHFGFDFLRIIV